MSHLEAIIEKQRKEVSCELHKIESTITIHKLEVMQECTNRIEKNSHDIKFLLDENKILRHENMSLKERISKIESNQLANNVIITGVPKQQWELYEVTKQCMLDTVAASMRSKSDDERQQNVLNVNQININYCTRVGRFRPNQNRPISVTFQNREDKDLLMSGKSNLPPGLYVNHEYPPHVKKNCDHLRPILWRTEGTAWTFLGLVCIGRFRIE